MNDFEQDQDFVVSFLKNHPDFFLRHPDLFLHINVPRQNREGNRSIVECQNEVLRATLTTYEMKEEELKLREQALNSSSDYDKLIRFAVELLSANAQVDLPNLVLNFFLTTFRASHGLVRLWPVKPNFSFFPFAERLGPGIENAVAEMQQPFAGENYGDEIAQWLKIDPVETRGVLILPLKKDNRTIGMLCLCDPDETKFSRNLRPKFLTTAASVAEAALFPLIN